MNFSCDQKIKGSGIQTISASLDLETHLKNVDRFKGIRTLVNCGNPLKMNISAGTRIRPIDKEGNLCKDEFIICDKIYHSPEEYPQPIFDKSLFIQVLPVGWLVFFKGDNDATHLTEEKTVNIPENCTIILDVGTLIQTPDCSQSYSLAGQGIFQLVSRNDTKNNDDNDNDDEKLIVREKSILPTKLATKSNKMVF